MAQNHMAAGGQLVWSATVRAKTKLPFFFRFCSVVFFVLFVRFCLTAFLLFPETVPRLISYWGEVLSFSVRFVFVFRPGFFPLVCISKQYRNENGLRSCQNTVLVEPCTVFYSRHLKSCAPTANRGTPNRWPGEALTTTVHLLDWRSCAQC